MPTNIDLLKEEIYKGDNAQSICDLIVAGAFEVGSSDIHIEPKSGVVRVRYRVDGNLQEIVEYQPYIHQQIVARYKILSNLKIDESRMPQDGRISREIAGKSVDLRVSTLPTVNGEKIVMRIVDKTKRIPPLSVLGFEGNNRHVLEHAIAQPVGVILTSGPTGSGKSTTLYSCLQDLNTPDVNIMTLEDPVEITVDGLNQSQMFPQIGYTFASGLRTALRQDPDIVMVGEIRDKETIDIAIEASLTGHLVFSTIHTNSAAETVTRILNMGVQPFLLPAALNAIIAQRLIRRICPACRKEVPFSEYDADTQARIRKAIARTRKDELLARVPAEKLKDPSFFRAVGCDKCFNTGYKGRLGIYEVMTITPEIKQLILKGASGVEIDEAAVTGGMTSLEQDGIIKALNGQTSLEEVYGAVKSEA